MGQKAVELADDKKVWELEDLDSFIVPKSLDDKQGIMGALKLGMIELEQNP